jgi:long-chain acyl-CoA synthetase
MMLDHPDFDPADLGSLKSMMYGGSPMPLAVQHRWREALDDCMLIQGYGMTEGLPVTLLDDQAHRIGGDLLRSAGRPCRGVILTVQDANGNEMPTGEAGEVCARSGIYMREYWNRPDETEAAFAGGWYHSGDVGYLDKDGYLFLVDRAKDMIVSGGENIYTSEVESAISTHADVAQVAVIGIPDDKYGEAVHAIVVPRPGTSPTEAGIIAHARESIAGYKCPRHITFREEPLPLSGANKVLKRALRDPYWEGVDRKVN